MLLTVSIDKHIPRRSPNPTPLRFACLFLIIQCLAQNVDCLVEIRVRTRLVYLCDVVIRPQGEDTVPLEGERVALLERDLAVAREVQMIPCISRSRVDLDGRDVNSPRPQSQRLRLVVKHKHLFRRVDLNGEVVSLGGQSRTCMNTRSSEVLVCCDERRVQHGKASFERGPIVHQST